MSLNKTLLLYEDVSIVADNAYTRQFRYRDVLVLTRNFRGHSRTTLRQEEESR
jgi:hypothetical protein